MRVPQGHGTMTSYPQPLNTTRFYEEDFPLLMPRWGYVVSAFVLFLIGFFGFFLNLMVILLMFKDRQLWTPLNIILFNLVCSDFSVSVLGNPFTLISALFHRWIFGPTMCMLYGFFMALLGITSITTLTVISFERYIVVTRPFSARHLTSRGAALAIMFIWTYSLALTTPPLMGWGKYVSEAANISCSVNWHEQSLNALTYILYLFALGQLVPFAVITFSYVNIIRTMRQNSKRLGRVSRAEARATTMVFIMIIAFTVAWTPYSIFALMEQFTSNQLISPAVGVIPALVAKSSICYDPLIYVGMNSQFRQSIKRVFGIHTKNSASRITRQQFNATSSPLNRMTSTNEFTTNLNSSDIANLKKRDKKVMISDEVTETNEYEKNAPRNFELSTISENKSTPDEKSGDTTYDEESNQSNKKENSSNEFTKLCDDSPTLTIVNAEKTVFSRYKTNEDDTRNRIMNIYGNQAYEEHFTDSTNINNDNKTQNDKATMRQSYSLDFRSVQTENKRRKLSIETKLEILSSPKGLFKDNVFTKLFDSSSKQSQDNFKSYLCDDTNDEDV